MAERTGIVIPANGKVTTTSARCLEALEANTPEPHRVYLFDRVPRLEVTRTWNRGARLAHEDGCDYVVLLNNDTQPAEGWLPPLVDDLEHEKHCAIGPVTTALGAGHQPRQAGDPNEPPRWEAIPWPKSGDGSSAPVGQGVALNGFCFAVRTARLLALPFDEVRWPFRGSEDYWFREAWIRWQLPAAIARHSYVPHDKSQTRTD